jgi:catechol 2,3-dioxygenase-like lactoylglutathione lyase family enzyme
MSRVQLALNVADIDEAVAFYSRLFDTPPAKVRPGYANFAVVDPPLKLVLIEDRTKAPGSLNHLGIEVADQVEVAAAAERLVAHGMSPRVEDGVSCCYAVQDKAWVSGPGGEPWEIYTVLADTEMADGQLRAEESSEPACCSSC